MAKIKIMIKYGIKEPVYKTEIKTQTWRADLCCQGGGRGSGMDRESGVRMKKQRGPTLYGTGIYIQCLGVELDGR